MNLKLFNDSLIIFLTSNNLKMKHHDKPELLYESRHTTIMTPYTHESPCIQVCTRISALPDKSNNRMHKLV